MEEKIKIYDLEERTALFAERICDLILMMSRNVTISLKKHGL